MKILVCWVGTTDLNAADPEHREQLGPIGRAIDARDFDSVLLLSNWQDDARVPRYLAWLRERASLDVHLDEVSLTSPVHFRDVYDAANAAAERARTLYGGGSELTFHLSPGTNVMSAVWMLLAKVHDAALIQSSIEAGVEDVDIPFDIQADLIPEIVRRRDRHLEQLLAGTVPASFEELVAHSKNMKAVVARAARAASRTVPVLLVGDSGTGKTTLASAIHKASPFAEGRFVPVNCGAVPATLFESLMFGHIKGAFTGAERIHRGHFQQADRGTLFLDEVGELDLDQQVKLLRALESGKIRPIGAPEDERVHVRIVAATNRDLKAAVARGEFREDLYYRLAVAVLRIPSLGERPADLRPLVDHVLDEIARESEDDPGFERREPTADAMAVLRRHRWPGNVRELRNVLWQATLWATGEHLEAADVEDALRESIDRPDDVLVPLAEGFDIKRVTDSVERHYLRQALTRADGNKTRAARMLGLNSHQVVTNWMERLGVERS